MHYRWAFSAESQSLCMCPLPGSAWESEGGKKKKTPRVNSACADGGRWKWDGLSAFLITPVEKRPLRPPLLSLLASYTNFARWLDGFRLASLSPSLAFSLFFLFISLPLTPSALDFMNLLNWCRWGACGTLSYWFAVGFGVVGNTSRSLGWTHEAFYLQSPSTGKSAFSIDFFIMSPWKANASTVWRAPTSPRSTRPLDHICHTLEAILYSSLPW